MKHLLLALLACGLVACASDPEPVADEAPADPIPVVVADQVLKIQATVVAIDKTDRVLTLQDASAQISELHVSDRVEDFNQIQVGDFVEADYIEAIAVFVQGASGEVPAYSDDLAIGLSEPGQLPGGVVAETQTITADVVDIDYGARTVVLRGPRGINRKFPVSNRMKNLEQVKKGDQVVVQHTKALAVGVRKPAISQ